MLPQNITTQHDDDKCDGFATCLEMTNDKIYNHVQRSEPSIKGRRRRVLCNPKCMYARRLVFHIEENVHFGSGVVRRSTPER
jgi:hypothetical protein